MFTEKDYEDIHALVFRPDYPGYKPNVVEIPAGDGRADAEKRYAHIAPKYFINEQQRTDLTPFLERAHAVALQAASALDLPWDLYPRIEYGALRILDYPPGAGSVKHQDFDLFTLTCYRDQPDKFVADDVKSPALLKLQSFNRQAHLGEMAAEMGIGPATPHEVLPSTTRQRSIVYFAIPNHDALMPGGKTVREFLNERMQRTRSEFKAYQ